MTIKQAIQQAQNKTVQPQAKELNHVAVIMDGNRRWAKKHNKTANAGHQQGAQALQDVVKYCLEGEIEWLTVYAFSIENWQRNKVEVDGLMELLYQFLKNKSKVLMEHGVRLNVIGDQTLLPVKQRQELNKVVEQTQNNDKLTLTLALSYGGRDEILRVVQKVAQDVSNQSLQADSIDNSVLESYLDTAGMPDPDLLIRTSGEKRLSNFLLWQLSYAELYFTDVYWPDFDEAEFKKAIDCYYSRERRFGQRVED